MIHSTPDFIKKFLKEHPISGRVLDVGSLDVNGNIRDKFVGFNYLGIDMRPGKNVDVDINAHDLKETFKKGEFDLVVCFDTLEHDDQFWLTIENMKWILKTGGWLLVGTPSINHPIHRHPFDYYRFTSDSFRDFIFKDMDNVFIEEQFYNKGNPDFDVNRPDQVMGWGQKP